MLLTERKNVAQLQFAVFIPLVSLTTGEDDEIGLTNFCYNATYEGEGIICLTWLWYQNILLRGMEIFVATRGIHALV